MENKYVRVRGIDHPEIIELPLDFDNTLSLAVLCSQFPYSNGLKYRNSKSNQIRSVRRTDDRFFLSADLKWDDFVFFCTCSQSRKNELLYPNDKSVIPRKRQSINSVYRKFPETFDLKAMGLSFDTTEEGLNNYLNRFGPTIYCKLNFDHVLKHSHGIAYFRFAEIKAQNRCLSTVHVVDKTKIIIKVPNEKINIKEIKSHKLYISNVSPTLTREDLRAYFSQYGNVIHVFMPPDKRNFAFLTFIDESSIERVLKDGQTHIFNGARVNVNLVVENHLVAEQKENSQVKKRKLLEKIEQKECIQSKKPKQSQKPETPITVENTKFVPTECSEINEQKENSCYNKRKLSQNPEFSVVRNIPKMSPPPCSAIMESPQYLHGHSSTSQIQSQFTHLITTQDFSQPPPLFIDSTIPPPNCLPHSSNSAIPVFHHPNHSLPLHRKSKNSVSSNDYNQYLSFPIQNTSLSPIISANPIRTEFHSRKTENDILSFNLNSAAFQSLVIKEILTQYKDINYKKRQIEKYHTKSRKSNSVNCSQLEHLVNQVCLLKHENARLKVENLRDNQFNKSQSKITLSHYNKTELPSLNDPKVRKALELLQDSKVVDMLIKLSEINVDNQLSNN